MTLGESAGQMRAYFFFATFFLAAGFLAVVFLAAGFLAALVFGFALAFVAAFFAM